MQTIKIRGYSDDLISIEGDFVDEFGSFDRPGFIHLANGAIIRGQYCDPTRPGKGWVFTVEKHDDSCKIVKLGDDLEGDGSHYSEVWEVSGERIAPAFCLDAPESPSQDEFEIAMDRIDYDDLSPAQRLRIVSASVGA